VSADCDRPTAATVTIIGENERHGVALGPLSSLGHTVRFAEPAFAAKLRRTFGVAAFP